jgi:hypothetical protein
MGKMLLYMDTIKKIVKKAQLAIEERGYLFCKFIKNIKN